MANLDQHAMQEFGARLRDRAGRLRNEIRSTMEKSSSESPARVGSEVRDVEDDSFANLIVDTNLAEIDRDTDELQRIDGALRRLEEGNFGMCVNCGEDIPRPRLEAEPTASRCVKCQELHEKTHVSASTPSL